MDWVQILLHRCTSLFRRQKLDEDLDDELRTHIEFAIEENRVRGMDEQEARTAALRAFGGLTQIKETYRMQRGLPFLEHMGRDLRFGFRQLRRSPGFAITAILTLALGVGANTAVFSLINGLLLRPLPVPHSEQLVVLGMEGGRPRPNYTFSAPIFRDLEFKHEIFTSVFAFSGRQNLQVRSRSRNESINGCLVSGDFFDALQTPPLMGRPLSHLDDQPGGSPSGFAVVISERFWETWFSRAPNVVGRKLEIANTIFTVAGVMPKRFIGADPTQRPDLFVPLSAEPVIDAPVNLIAAGGNGWWLAVMGRLQPGVTLGQANAALQPLSMPIVRSEIPDPDPGWLARAEKDHFHFFAEPGSRGFTFIRLLFQKPLVASLVMCGGILLLACLNLAILLLARGATRERELATRLALGATRIRLIGQLLIESLLLATMGTMLGLALAPVVGRSLGILLLHGNVMGDLFLDNSIDSRVIAFAALIAVTAAVLIGLVPALQATSGNLNDHIKNGQRGMQAHERRRILPRVLLAAEVGLALTLVVSACLLATSLLRLYKSGTGFDPKGVVNIALDMGKQPLDGDELTLLYRQFTDELSHQPGVRSVSLAQMIPLSGFGWGEDHWIPGGIPHSLDLNAVSQGYFQTMRIPMFAGRDFRWSDTTPTGLKIIINQSAAKLFFPGRDAIGQQILRQFKKTPYEVIAVVGDAKSNDLRSPPRPAAYVPITQSDAKKPSYSAVVRVEGPTAPMVAAARALASRLAPQIPAPVVTTMDSVMNDSISSERMMAMLSVFFAGCALLVTAIGLYGTLAYATARRTSEIGIRMALGARRIEVVGMVFRENALLVAGGTVAGLVVALLATRALASFLYGTSVRDPWVMLASVAALVAVASAASLIPAIRAARIDPMAALREE